MKHYFKNDETPKRDRREITFRFFGRSYHFVTDSGVFAKSKVDYGSQLLLEELVKTDLKGSFCDFGSGYGVIGIVLAKHLNLDVVAVDVNQRALELCEMNAKLNQVTIKTIYSTGNLKLDNLVDTIALNPPIKAGKAIIYQMFQEAKDWLNPNGRFFIVMRKDHGAKSAIAKLQEIFSNVEILQRSKGFWIILAYNRV